MEAQEVVLEATRKFYEKLYQKMVEDKRKMEKVPEKSGGESERGKRMATEIAVKEVEDCLSTCKKGKINRNRWTANRILCKVVGLGRARHSRGF